MKPDEFTKDLETKSLAPTFNESGKEDTATEFFDHMSWGAKTSADDPQGTQIGKYTLIEKLGEGGFGTVWRAEQQQPVRREVAVKILKLGMDSREIVARFAQERQALAIMEHPGIAKVLDAGVSDTGRPYFVMELVRGVPLNQFCNTERLDTQDRLRLFIQVCNAVHHAHLKGIIHRDLKPGNILVSKSDAGIQPKVIDFGIAKATTSILPDMSMQTRVGQFMGTPAYMSPEQAEGLVNDLDMRSDVYSLDADRLDEATVVLDEAKRVGGDGKSADNSLGVAHAKLELARGNLQEAERIAREDLEDRKKESRQPSIIQVEAMQTLAAIHARQGDLDSAKNLLNEAMTILRPSENPTSIMLKSVQRDLEKLEKEKLEKEKLEKPST